MPRWAWNKAPEQCRRKFFELIRQGASGLQASLAVGVSPSCGSLWFIDAGRVNFLEPPISSRYLSQDDRIEIADGLAAGEPVKSIAARIGKSYQTVYREIARSRCVRWSRTSCLDLVTASDQPLAAPPLPAPIVVACERRDDLSGRLPRLDRSHH